MSTAAILQPPIVFLAFAGVAIENHVPLPRLADEAAQLRKVFSAAERSGACRLVLLENATLSQILDTFQDPDLHARIAVFHFAGHADSYELLMEEAPGKKLLVDSGGLAAFLAEQPGLRLVFLNACNTEEQVGALHAAGVQAVVATSQDVPDDWAVPFAVRFYKGMIGRASIASSVRMAEAEMRAQYGERSEWPWELHVQSQVNANWQLLGAQSEAEPPWRVPFLRNDSFVGREEDLENLHTALIFSDSVGIRPAGLTGMGGMGKTQLAVEYCYRYRESYPNGIFWINAAADWRDEFAALGTYLRPELAGEPEVRRIRAVADYLKTQRDCLLVLDNVEDPARVLQPVTAELLPLGLACRLLVTTRRRDLSQFRSVEVTILPDDVALQLLLRDEQRRPALEPSHPEYADGRAICRMLGGLPLALEIAAAFLAEWPEVSLPDFRQRLYREGILATLDIEGNALSPSALRGIHAAAVAATLGEQWDALGSAGQSAQDARLLLRVAGQLPEGVQVPGARLGLLACLSEDNSPGKASRLSQALHLLERVSLIEYLRAGELRMHPLVREFAAAQTPPELTQMFRGECARNVLIAYQSISLLERDCERHGVDGVEQNLVTALTLLPTELKYQISQEKTDTTSWLLRCFSRHKIGSSTAEFVDTWIGLDRLLRMVQQESHTLRGWNKAERPAMFLQQWQKRSLINCAHKQLRAVNVQLAGLAVPHLSMQWTTAQEFTSLERTLIGHTELVSAVALSANGQWAISSSEDDTLKVWELKSGQELFTLRGHIDRVNAVKVAADGNWAVSVSHDRTVRVWDLQNGCLLQTLRGHVRPVTVVAITPDGYKAVSASDDHTLRIWDLERGCELHTLRGHESEVRALAITPNGQIVISASNDRTLKVWDITNGRELHTLKGHSGVVLDVVTSLDGRQAISASDSAIKIWDLETGYELHNLVGHAGYVHIVTLTPDGKKIVSGAADGTVRVWDLYSGRALCTYKGHTSWVNAVKITPDGEKAISASNDRNCQVWDLRNGSALHTLVGHADAINSVTITPDGQYAVSASDDRTLKVWNLEREREQRNIKGHNDLVRAVAVTSDGRRAVTASNDRTLKVWSLNDGSQLSTLSGHKAGVRAVAVTANGRKLVSVSDDHVLMVWNLNSGRHLHTLSGHIGSVNALAMTPDERALSGSADRTIKVWDLKSGDELRSLKGHTAAVTALAVAPDGKWAVSGSDDSTLRVWDLKTGEERKTLTGHTAGIHAVSIMSDGWKVVSVSMDGSSKVWDLESGEALRTINNNAFWIRAVAFAPDGQSLIMASWDNTLKAWDLVNGRELCTIGTQAGTVNTLAVTSDGLSALSASGDGVLSFWNLNRGTLLANIVLDTGLPCIAAVRDGSTIVIGDNNGNVYCLRYGKSP